MLLNGITKQQKKKKKNINQKPNPIDLIDSYEILHTDHAIFANRIFNSLINNNFKKKLFLINLAPFYIIKQKFCSKIENKFKIKMIERKKKSKKQTIRQSKI